ncbi:TIGR04283 family arsenosugar biosynthesis glycosyltransferase [Candidatus Nitronereus thalassa]|uniref:TIGR04283 family arsenosugar biosynthesis glycosyltransferase n=1 Tax=Candidatus Nitronereus thalassa TaxID=3020898 RepID=A0ABU3KC85_9BACT|nr:TIGR04283 family arsenosugar biosynthesis glycosyltransferase [Candidatus Nitronereus thalassa]MDT7044046.1 TIGR04283 family arsenosugar biosynthesis glycosyltransferase [Candidatus Nitronereus thalassa]
MIYIIIPAYNEENALPFTLSSLRTAHGCCEIIVVDGGSTDRTPHIAKGTPSVTLLTAPKGRASQMNTGAAYAIQHSYDTQNWLLFLHADTTLPEGSLQRLQAMHTDAMIQAGGFFHQFSGDDWRLRFISWLDNFRCTHSRIIYGDQALFVRCGLFEQLGGFPNQPILEDVAFCEKLIQHTRPILLTPPVVTDSRKFVQMGIWRSLARVFLIILSVEFRLPMLAPAFFRDIR